MDEEVQRLYYRVIDVANYFLQNASHLTIEALKEFDPSIEELAKSMRMLANILNSIAGSSYDDESMAINALQCCLTMERLANIIAQGDGNDLEQLIQQLELHTNVP